MTTRRDPDQRQAVASLERQLLGRLGLGMGASNDQVESAHEEVVQYLESAPQPLRTWSQAQLAAADEAYALLRGPREDLVAAAAEAAGPSLARVPVAGVGELDRPSRDREHDVARAGQSDRQLGSARIGESGNRLGRTARRVLLAGGGAAAVIAVAILVYNLGGGSVPGFTGTPAPEASTAGVDTAKVATLMKQLASNPNDTATLQSIGDLYYAAGDYASAATWMERILTVDPKNVNAMLALGAVKFNVGSIADAEAQWRKVLTIDPKNVEAHYDLGFMYLSANPPDVANVKVEWNEVIALAPDSDVAKTVATHLKSLDTAASPAASGSPAPAVTAAPSPASASPAPSPSSGG